MKRVYLTLLVLLVTVAGAVAALQQEDEFPHIEHARLFPLCTGCHEGVPDGDRARFYPARMLCASCHNGTDQQRVSWEAPGPQVNNLDFSHPEHEAEEPLDCSACHTRAGQPRMAVERRVVPERCFACHEHQAREHFVDARCEQCHVPLSRTTFAAARVANLPEPASHKQPDFLAKLHGELAKSDRTRCQVCHTRELCATCHVDAQQRAEVQAFEPAGANLQLPPFTARYYEPESHKDAQWIDRHGGPARQNIANCSTCHTRESCATCHAVNTPDVVRALPSRVAATAPGVSATRRAPATHRTPFFAQEHGTLAAAGGQTCLSCHTRTQCEECHSAASAGRDRTGAAAKAPSALHVKASGVQVQDTGRRARPPVRQRAGYHPANFMERHAVFAYNRNMECANCHETSRFCRDCHEQRGMGTTGRIQPGFHDAQPLWLLNHGKPARQGLESCASCHKQTDCMQCHSSIGSFRVSPHGRGFDAKRVQDRNARLCFTCHLTDPLESRTQ
ncbi:MAG TPA: hypothetical protein VFO52_15820 [Longimicrobiales bacterium]|nr:hypothetical protein [Longimicrobiales bacterium]